MQNNDLIPELLSEVSTYLSKPDCFNCMSVSRHWYNRFKPAFYKRVDIMTSSQFDKFLQELIRYRDTDQNRKKHTELGYLVKELRLISNRMYCPMVILTQDKLNLLNDLCPRLELLKFDSSQWDNINDIAVFKKWENLRSIAPLHCKYVSHRSFTYNLTDLQVFHTSQEENQQFEAFSNMPLLTHLTLDIFCGQNNAHINLDISQYMKKLHAAVPQLETLCLILTNALNEVPDISTMHQDVIKLKSLSLKGIPAPYKWIQYIAQHYRLLESLEISQPIVKNINTFTHSDSLVQLVQQLSLLQNLTLKGETAYYLYSDALINGFSKPRCRIHLFDIDFNSYDINKSIKFLNSIAKAPPRQLQKLQLRVWNQFLSWPGSIQGLYRCKNLVDLELSFARGFMDPSQYTMFVLDEFSEWMSQIKRLCLRGADIQIGGYNKRKAALEVLNLEHSRVASLKDFSRFVSNQCTSLNNLSLSKWEDAETLDFMQNPTCTLNLLNNRLEKLHLSTILFYSGIFNINRFLAINLSVENQPSLTDFTIWLVKQESKQIYPSYRLATLEEKANIEVGKLPDLKFASFCIRCKSLRQLYLDDIKLPLLYYY